MQALCPGQRGAGELSGRSWQEAHASVGCRPMVGEKRAPSPPCGSAAGTAKVVAGAAGVSLYVARTSSSSDAKTHAVNTRRCRRRARGGACFTSGCSLLSSSASLTTCLLPLLKDSYLPVASRCDLGGFSRPRL